MGRSAPPLEAVFRHETKVQVLGTASGGGVGIDASANSSVAIWAQGPCDWEILFSRPPHPEKGPQRGEERASERLASLWGACL